MSPVKKAIIISIIMLFILLMTAGCKRHVNPAAEETFKSRIGDMTVVVYPTVLRGHTITYDENAAWKLVDFLCEEKLAEATVFNEEVAIPKGWSVNESKMWRQSAEALTAQMMANPVTADYGMMAEYLLDRNGKPIGIHLYVVDAESRIAAGVGVNSHHRAFRDAAPQNADDATRVLIVVLRDEIKKMRTEGKSELQG